jgi:hypothetical protein
MQLAMREGREDEDANLPDPADLPFSPDELEFMYELWTIWVATDKKYLPSQLVPELLSGYGRILTGLFDMDALYSKTKADLKSRMPQAKR